MLGLIRPAVQFQLEFRCVAKKASKKPEAERKSLLPSMAGLESLWATHLTKFYNTDIPWSQRILHLGSMHRTLDNSVGVCSASIDSRYPLTVSTGALDITMATAIASDLGANEPGSAIEFLFRQQPEKLLNAGFPSDEVEELGKQISNLEDYAPNCVSKSQKQVFFEGDGVVVIVTPVVSASVMSEINARASEAYETYERTKADGVKFQSLFPAKIDQPFGGSNPRNAGHMLNGNSRSTRHGKSPFLKLRVPNPRENAISHALRKMGALGSYDAVVTMDRDELREYANRSTINIDLRTHKDAEILHARDLASTYLETAAKLRSYIAEFDNPLCKMTPFDRMNADEVALVDPKSGIFKRDALTERFARLLARRIEKSSSRNGNATILSDRSMLALTSAFRTELSCF